MHKIIITILALVLAACGGGSGESNSGGGNSAPVPQLTVEGATADESAGSLAFIVRVSEPPAAEVRVDFSTLDESALAGADYTARSGVLSFDKTNLSRVVNVDLLDNSRVGADKSFALQLSNPVGAELSSGYAVGLIRDDDGATPRPPTPPGPMPQYNVVVIFTDDQRFDTLEEMPVLASRLLPNGVNFTNAYVPTPLCCPARVSTYTGGYLAQNTGVLNNRYPNGGVRVFDDTINIGTLLQGAGYRTMFIGKWQNDYPDVAPYIPPGWDRFVARNVLATQVDWSNFGYVAGSSNQNSSTGAELSGAGRYHVYFEQDQILNFITAPAAEEPFFVFWATTGPHSPAQPAPGDQNAFADFKYRGRASGETDLTDKPQWVLDEQGKVREFQGDSAVRAQLQSMLSVDRSIGVILDQLEAQGVLDETVIIFTSDNGFMWGEHGIWGKNKAFEESIKVPLLIVMPGIERRVESKLASAVLDLGPTVFDIAGLPDQGTDGTSLVPLLNDPGIPWRKELFYEKYAEGKRSDALWVGLRDGKWKYVHYWTGEEELYDLTADPFELENLAAQAARKTVLERLRRKAAAQQGVAIKPVYGWASAYARQGEPYTHQFEAWGGAEPFVWEVDSGELPPGIRLNASTGRLSGIPTATGSWEFRVRVADSKVARQAGRPRAHISDARRIIVQ